MAPLEERPTATAAVAPVGVGPRCLAQVFDVVVVSVVAAASIVRMSSRRTARLSPAAPSAMPITIEAATRSGAHVIRPGSSTAHMPR